MKKVRNIEEAILAMSGDQLLDELISHAAQGLDRHQRGEDHHEAIVRAIQARLAATGIARKYHGEACRFMLGDDRCPCSSASWSWPLKGLRRGL